MLKQEIDHTGTLQNIFALVWTLLSAVPYWAIYRWYSLYYDIYCWM